MRLRLEPTVNVTEQVRVKAQLDVFDNLVMGSTPESYYINERVQRRRRGLPDVPTAAFAQPASRPSRASTRLLVDPRQARLGRGSHAVRRAALRPHAVALGHSACCVNNGDCLDCDFGANADRVMFATKLWGHFIAFMWDWVATGPTTQIIGPQQGQGVVLQRRHPRRRLAVDPGARQDGQARGAQREARPGQGRLQLRRLLHLSPAGLGPAGPAAVRPRATPATQLQGTTVAAPAPRRSSCDIWLRLNWKKLHLEAEGAIVAGTIGNLTDVFRGRQGLDVDPVGRLRRPAPTTSSCTTRSSSTSKSATPRATTPKIRTAAVNFNAALRWCRSTTASARFTFDPDYHVDLILFRRILGTVNNATYFKPGVSYDIVDNFGARVDIMYAIANKPVGYPGNSYNLGLEIDAAAHLQERGRRLLRRPGLRRALPVRARSATRLDLRRRAPRSRPTSRRRSRRACTSSSRPPPDRS